MSDQARIKAFVLKFLRSSRAEVSEADGRIYASLPKELAASLACERTLCLSFAPGEEGAEYVTFGHPLLEGMIDIARSRGLAANLLFITCMEPEFSERLRAFDPFRPGDVPQAKGAFAELVRQARRLSPPGERVRVEERRLTHQRQILFYFRAALLSDEKWETVIPILVDPVTEEVDRPVDVTHAVSFAPHGEVGSNPEQDHYNVERLYRKAGEHVRARLAGRIARFEQEARERLQAETRRIETYYRGMAEELLDPLRGLFRRIAAAGARADLARSWRTASRPGVRVEELRAEVGALEEAYRRNMEALLREKELRLSEVREKYAVRVEIALTHAAFVMVPRVEWRLRISEGDAAREATLLYDVLRRRFVDWACECCGQEAWEEMRLCRCGTLACASCRTKCEDCRMETCAECSGERCAVCGEPACGRCLSAASRDEACFAGREAPQLSLCTRCRRSVCAPIERAMALHLESCV